MEELKFKAVYDGKIYPVDLLYFYPDGSVSVEISNPFHVVETPDVKLIQYTELKDVNGIELYEYDIICQYKGSKWERTESVGDLLEVGYQVMESLLMDGDFEIIGNLYTNTELLEK